MLTLLLIVIIIYYCFQYLELAKSKKDYYFSSYYLNTKNSYYKVMCDKGLKGEYDTYAQLRWLERYGVRFLFNLYVPTENGETTEIDLVLITKKRIICY